jgi:hypothetical protein
MLIRVVGLSNNILIAVLFSCIVSILIFFLISIECLLNYLLVVDINNINWLSYIRNYLQNYGYKHSSQRGNILYTKL